MANSGITANVAVTPEAFALAVRKHLWDATTLGNGPTERFLEWKDWADAVFTALQSGLAGVTGEAGALAETVADADFVASAGWDSAGDVDTESASGTVQVFQFAVTPGGSVVAAPQTVTLTFPTAFATAPRAAIPVKIDHDDNSTVTGWSVETLTTTTLVLRTIGNPVDATTETCKVVVIL